MYEEKFMREALRLAHESAKLGEVPVGCVIVKNGEIISQGMNLREAEADALGHAELIAISQACEKLGGWRLSGCNLYVTLEPCPMCAGAIINSRIENVYFGAFDTVGGCCGSKLNLLSVPDWYHPSVQGGYMLSECKNLLKAFFSTLREKKKNKQNGEKMILSMIVAKGNNNEIGGDNKLLWHISADLKYFKSVTMGKAVIMGRKTFESLPKVLPGRKNIVITRNPEYKPEGVCVVSNLDDAVSAADTDEAFIIGGESIYRAFLDKADRLYITEVDTVKPEADAFFPDFDKDLYDIKIVGEGKENDLSYKHIIYSRKADK